MQNRSPTSAISAGQTETGAAAGAGGGGLGAGFVALRRTVSSAPRSTWISWFALASAGGARCAEHRLGAASNPRNTRRGLTVPRRIARPRELGQFRAGRSRFGGPEEARAARGRSALAAALAAPELDLQ